MSTFSKFFYTFLDISGILLGVFLFGLGLWIVTGHAVSTTIGYIVLFLGVAAFFIHTGHYFNLKIARWLFGKESYFHLPGLHSPPQSSGKKRSH